jgi:SP family galactose:H+ symporter-like MFS transporter
MGNTFLLYAALTLCGLVFAWLLVPETKGVRLEDIEADLYAGKPVRRLGRSPGG